MAVNLSRWNIAFTASDEGVANLYRDLTKKSKDFAGELSENSKANRAFNRLSASLEKQNRELGLGTNAAKLHGLAIQGATQDQLDFIRSLQKTNTQLRTVRTGFSRMSDTLRAASTRITGAVAGVIAALAAFRAISNQFNESRQRIDRFAKTAARLDESYDTIRALGLAAQLTGTDFETMEQALQDLAERASEATRGVGEGVDALKLLQLDPELLVSSDALTRFQLIARRLESLENSADRVAVAMQLFGDAGVGLLNLLDNGAPILDEVAAKVENISLSLEDTQAVESMNDAFIRLSASWNSFIDQITVNLAGPLETVAGWVRVIVSVMRILNEATRLVIRTINVAFVGALGKVVSLLAGLIGDFATLARRAADFRVPGAETLAQNLDAAADSMTRFSDSLRDTNREYIDDIKEGFSTLLEAPAEGAKRAAQVVKKEFEGGISVAAEAVSNASTEIFAPQIEAFNVLKDRLTKMPGELIDAGQKLADDQAAFRFKALAEQDLKEKKALETLADSVIRSIQTPQEKLDETIEKLKKLNQEGFIDPDQFARAMDQAKEQFDKTIEKLDKSVKEAEKPGEAIDTPAFAAAVERGSVAAYSAALRNFDTRSIEQSQLNEQKKMVRSLRKLEDKIVAPPRIPLTEVANLV